MEVWFSKTFLLSIEDKQDRFRVHAVSQAGVFLLACLLWNQCKNQCRNKYGNECRNHSGLVLFPVCVGTLLRGILGAEIQVLVADVCYDLCEHVSLESLDNVVYLSYLWSSSATHFTTVIGTHW